MTSLKSYKIGEAGPEPGLTFGEKAAPSLVVPMTQFSKMLSPLAKSLGRLEQRISTLAISDIHFDPSLGKEFRKVATAKIYGSLLANNPKLKLVRCDE